MSDQNPGPRSDADEATRTVPDNRWRDSLGARVAAATVIAGGLAAGGYGIASAAASPGAAPHAAPPALATAASPAKSAPSHPRLGGPLDPGLGGDFGLGASFGQSGTVMQVTPTTITVESLFGDSVTVTTDSSTVYNESGRKVARSAVAAGEQVVFSRAERAATSSSSGSAAVALVEIVQPHVLGKVVSANGSELVVSQQDGLNVTVNTSAQTTYDEVGQPASASDVQVGTVVFVTGSLSSNHDQIDASSVKILLPSVSGRVVGVSGTTISVTTFDGTAETLTTDSSTVFRDESGTTTIASVTKGDLVRASGEPGTGNSFAAVTVYVGASMTSGPRGFAGLGGLGGQGTFSGVPGGGPWSGTAPGMGAGKGALTPL